jgi:hypothetical protein
MNRLQHSTFGRVPISFRRIDDSVEYSSINLHLKTFSPTGGDAILLIPVTVIFVPALLLSIATGFSSDSGSVLCLVFGMMEVFILAQILRQFVVLTEKQVFAGSILWKWRFSEATAIEYAIIDSVSMSRNYTRPCLNISSSGAEVTVKLVRGWRKASLVPALQALERHGLGRVFDERCRRLLETAV